MAIINSYTRDTDIKNSDVFIGTKFSNRQTVNFTAQTVADYLNINGKISIAGQMLWKFVVINPGNGTMSFEGGGGEGEPFEDITELILSKTDGSGQFVNIFLDYLVDTQILLSQQSTINQFGHYKIVSYAVQPDPNFYKLTLEFIGGNGGLIKDAYYDMASFQASVDVVIPNLQEVTNAGSITSNNIELIEEAELRFENIGINKRLSGASILSLTGIQIFNLPDVGGIIPISVNGQIADANGNITLPDTTIPTLQTVTDAGATTTNAISISIPSNTLSPAFTVTSDDINSNGIPSIKGIGVNDTVGVFGTSDDNTGVFGTSIHGNAIVGISTNSIGGVFFSTTGKASTFNINTSNTSNIVEFQKNSINQAYVTHNGTIVSNKLLVNTTVDNGIDASQVNGSGLFQNTVSIKEGLLKLYDDFGSTYTSLYSGLLGFTVERTNSGFSYSISDSGQFVTNASMEATSFIKTGGLSTQFLMADGSVTTGAGTIPTLQEVTDAGSSTTNEITANKFIKELGVSAQFLKADGSVDNNVYLTSADLPSTLDLFATTTPDTLISGYSVLVRNILDPRYDDVAVNVSTGAITTTNQLLSSLITDTNVISGNPGVFNFTTIGNIRRVSGSGEATFYFRIYKRDSLGVETFITQSDNTLPVIDGGTYVEFSAVALWNDGVFLSTDRIVLKYYANRISGGSNPTYNFQFGGLTPVRGTAAVPVAVLPNIYLSNLVDVEDVPPLPNEILYWNDTASLWEHSLVNDLLVMPTLQEITDAGSTTTNSITTAGFIKTGGTSDEFLKADGSVSTGGGSTKSINSVSTNTAAGSASSTDYFYFASSTINLTLPTAVGNTNNYTIKNVGTGVITVNTTSSQTIDGSLTAPIIVQYLSLTIISDGANWNII